MAMPLARFLTRHLAGRTHSPRTDVPASFQRVWVCVRILAAASRSRIGHTALLALLRALHHLGDHVHGRRCVMAVSVRHASQRLELFGAVMRTFRTRLPQLRPWSLCRPLLLCAVPHQRCVPRSRQPLSVVHHQTLAALDMPCAVPACSSQQALLVALPRCPGGPDTFRAVRHICSRSYTELHVACRAGARWRLPPGRFCWSREGLGACFRG
ncbi:hypothetical protein OH77DRAFT_1024294 [Trametes cingulata]|nr:hypothetical protein OH77DRAFT_1024294 [Trametes cingulata]